MALHSGGRGVVVHVDDGLRDVPDWERHCAAFLITQLGEATIRLAISADRAEDATLVDA